MDELAKLCKHYQDQISNQNDWCCEDHSGYILLKPYKKMRDKIEFLYDNRITGKVVTHR